MKPYFKSLKKGQEVWAVVQECIAGGEVIINFNGDLVRVKNETERLLRVGQRVLLLVDSIVPFRLKLVMKTSRQRTQDLRCLDVSV